MEDEKPKQLVPGEALKDLFIARDPNLPPPVSLRKKRRRKGYLNDGRWAPGYGPDAKKPKG